MGDIYINKPIIQKDTTPPPKVIDMKFYPSFNSYFDGLADTEDKIKFNLTLLEDEALSRSSAHDFMVDIENLDTGQLKSFVRDAQKPFRLWQMFAETFHEIAEEEANPDSTQEPTNAWEDLNPEAVVNGRITIRGINHLGTGKASTFLIPFKDLAFYSYSDLNTTYVTSILKKYWHLYSETPENRTNRPKTMHIYYDVGFETVEDDRTRLSDSYWKYTSTGDWKFTNQQQYRWLFNQDGNHKLTYNGWKTQTEEETEFLQKLIDGFMPMYRNFLSERSLGVLNPHIFKSMVINPYDDKDSIIIYFMKGSQWQF